MVRLAVVALSVVLLVGCSRDLDESPYAAGAASFVAEDAGQIPLTSPGTPTRVERSTIEVPLPLFEELPESDHGPGAVENDTMPTDRASATVSRQQRAIDTVRIDSVQPAPVPLVRPPRPPPVPVPAEPTPPVVVPPPRPPTAPVSVPQQPPAPATPAPSDTGRRDDGGDGTAPEGS